MNTEKAVNKAFSIKPSKIQEIGKHRDITRWGAFSQFVNDAIDEKLDRIEQLKPQQELKAS